MLILNGKYEKIKNSGFYDDNCWDYPCEEEKMLWKDKQYSNVIYVKAENERIYETNCTINDLEDLIKKLDEEEQFKYKKFYCVYVNENDENFTLSKDRVEDEKQLNIYIKDEEELIHINTFYIQKNASLDETRKLLEDVLCYEIGKVLEDGTIEKEFHGQGYIYKNYENFYTREGVCYVPEYGGNKIDNAGVTYDDIRNEVIDLHSCKINIENVSNKEIDTMIVDVFNTVDWQHTSTLISEDWLDGYVENISKKVCNEEEM